MTVVIAGSASGFIMALVFAAAGAVMLFSIAKDPPPAFRLIFEKFRPATLGMAMVTLGYPVWGIIGTLMGLLYRISSEEAPGPGMGSPNMVFTLAVVAMAVMMAAPFAVLLRRHLVGVLIIALAFMGLFGWFLPFFIEAE
jgi:hypothetical protein